MKLCDEELRMLIARKTYTTSYMGIDMARELLAARKVVEAARTAYRHFDNMSFGEPIAGPVWGANLSMGEALTAYDKATEGE